MAGINWLDKLFAQGMSAVTRVYYAAGELVNRGIIEFTGAGVSVADSPGTGRTVVTIPGVASSYAANDPETVGTANYRGSSADPARRNHVHAHGNHLGGSLHAVAVGGEVSPSNGFMTGAMVDDLDDATAALSVLDDARTIARVAGDPVDVGDDNLATVAHAPRKTRTIYGTATFGAAVEAAQAAGLAIELVDGDTYQFEKRFDLLPNLPIRCPSRVKGGARFTSAFVSVAGADTDDGYLMRARATRGSQVGVMHATAYQGGNVVRWSFNPTVGLTYQIETGDASLTAQTGNVSHAIVAGAYLTSTVTVLSAVSVGGGDYDVTLDQDLSQAHFGHASTTPTSKVYATTPFEEVYLENCWFDMAGTSHAVGLLCQGVRRVITRGVAISGFSRAAIRATWGTTLDVEYVALGGCNAYVWASSCPGIVRARIDRGKPKGDRVHSLGVPRGAVVADYNSSDLVVTGEIRNAVTAVNQRGGVGVIMAGLRIWDCDQTERQSRDASINPATVGGVKRCGAAISIGDYGTTTDKMKEIDLVVDGVEIYNCGAITPSAALTQPAVFISDGDALHIPSIGIHNNGAASNGAQIGAPNYGPVMLGMMIADAFNLSIGDYRVGGACLAFMFSGNGLSKVTVETYTEFARDGSTNTAFWFASFDEATALDFHIKQMNVYSITDGRMGYSALGSTPVAAVMMGVRIDQLVDTSNGRQWSNCVFAKAAYAGTIGTAVELYDDAGVLSIRLPTGTHGATLGVTIRPYGDANNDFAIGQWVLVAKGPHYCVASSENPAVGTVMTLGTSGDVIAHVAGEPYSPIGTVVRTKDAFSGALVQLFRSGGQLTTSADLAANTIVMRSTTGALGRDAGASPAVSAGLDVEVGQYGGTSGQTGYLRLLRSGAAFLRLYKVHASALAMIEAAASTYLYLSSPSKSWLGIDANGASWPYIQADQADASVTLGGQISTPVKTHARTGTLTPQMNSSTASALNQAGNVEAGEELTGPITWANPTGAKAGLVKLTLMWRGDGTQTVAFGSNYRFGASGSNQAPASPAANDTVYVCNFESFNGTIFRCTETSVTPA